MRAAGRPTTVNITRRPPGSNVLLTAGRRTQGGVYSWGVLGYIRLGGGGGILGVYWGILGWGGGYSWGVLGYIRLGGVELGLMNGGECGWAGRGNNDGGKTGQREVRE